MSISTVWRARDVDIDIRNEVILARSIALSGSIAVVLIGFVYKRFAPGAFDPWILRLLVAFGAFTILPLTFVDSLKRHAMAMVFVWFLIVTSWTSWVMYINDFSADYSLSVMLNASMVGLTMYRRPYFIIASLVVIYTEVALVAYLVESVGLSEVIFFTTITGVGTLSFLYSGIVRKFEGDVLKNEQVMRVVFDKAGDVLILADFETFKIERVNDATMEMFGFRDRSEVVGRDASVFVERGLPADQLAQSREAVGSKGYWQSESQFGFAGQRPFWGSVFIKAIELQGAKKLLVRVSDITVAKEVEQESVKRAADLEKVNEMMVGRELRMAELKKEIKRLKGEL